MNVNLVSWWAVAGITMVAVGTLAVGAVLVRRGFWARLAAAVVVPTLLVACALAGANAYFQYIPTSAALIGHQRDEVALGTVVQEAPIATNAVSARTLPSHGSLVEVPIPGLVSHFKARPAEVYLPPAWSQVPRPVLPVVMLLHGTPGSSADWSRGGGAIDISDAWAAGHDGWAPIVVMPDINGSFLGDTECVNGKQGQVDTYLTTDVRAFVTATFGASSDPRQWVVGGLSEGGYCSAMLTLRHPDAFTNFLDFGGDALPSHTGGLGQLFAGPVADQRKAADSYTLADQLKTVKDPGALRGWIICGASDAHDARASMQFGDQARAAGIDVQVRMLPDQRHTFSTWKQSLSVAYPDVVGRLEGVGNASQAIASIG